MKKTQSSENRLTHRETPDKHAYVNRNCCELHWYTMTDEGYSGKAIEKLAMYEDAEEAGKLVQLPKGITLDEITAIMQQRTISGKNKVGLDEYTLDYASQFLHDAGFTEASKALDCKFDL